MTNIPSAQLRLRQSIKGRFFLTALPLVALYLALAATALYIAILPTTEKNTLEEEHLQVMHQAQELLGNSISIEYQVRTLIYGSSHESAKSYTRILKLLDESDALVSSLGQTTSGPTILDMHHISQLFRNTIHIVANLRSEILNESTPADDQERIQKKLELFEENLNQQMNTMMITSSEFSSRINFDYRATLEQSREAAQQLKNKLIAGISASLFLAFFTGYYFYRNTISRLQKLSSHLRQNTSGENRAPNISQNDDEIAAMEKSLKTLLSNHK